MKIIKGKSKFLWVIAALAVLIGGWLLYSGVQFAVRVNQGTKLCDETYQKKASTHPETFNTFEYEDRVKCYAALAVDLDYLAICDRLDAVTTPYTEHCYVQFAIAKNDVSVCDKLKGVLDSGGKDLQYDRICNNLVTSDIVYLDQNDLYVKPNKDGDIIVLTPKAGDILEVNKKYRITWDTNNLLVGDTLSIILDKPTSSGSYIASNIPALQGYYDWLPSGSYSDGRHNIKLKGGHPSDFDPRVSGESDYFEITNK